MEGIKIVILSIVVVLGVLVLCYFIWLGKKINNDNEIGYIKCKICGFKFRLNSYKTYYATDFKKTGLSTLWECKEDKIYLACDCPNCKGQEVLQEVKRKIEINKKEHVDEKA